MNIDHPAVRLYQGAAYGVLRVAARVIAVCLFDYRSTGSGRMPASGPVLVLSNHQSTLDPMLLGIIFSRPLQFLAKKSLFDRPISRFVMETYNALPIYRSRGGLEGMRTIIARLKAGYAVVLFPEGTRAREGGLLPIKGGFVPIARRSDAIILPVAIVGANEAMEPQSFLPKRRRIAAAVGPPLPPGGYAAWSDEELLRWAGEELRHCWDTAAELRRR